MLEDSEMEMTFLSPPDKFFTPHEKYSRLSSTVFTVSSSSRYYESQAVCLPSPTFRPKVIARVSLLKLIREGSLLQSS
jgi:hypothetical protein